MSDYRINVRFHDDNEEERRAAEYLKRLHRSRNQFVVDAVLARMDDTKLLDNIRQIFREEVVPLAESVALKTRALPAYTGHPQAEAMVQEAIEEAVLIEMGFTEEGWFCLRMPILLPRKEKSSRSYLRGFLYPALVSFTHGKPRIRYRDCVLIFRHVYDRNRPEREYRDHDNIELNTVVDAIAMFFLVDDTPLECRHYYCSAAGDTERTEVYIVPREDFEEWLDIEKEPEKLREKLLENPPTKAGF